MLIQYLNGKRNGKGYEYTDDFGNKASAKVEIIFDNIPPKVEILNPTPMETFNTNAIPVKWTVNGEVQDTLTLQRLEKGVNHVIRRYVDKAGNVAADTITVIMKEAKDIDISLVHPVTKVDQDKVDEYYSEGHKYNDKKPYDDCTSEEIVKLYNSQTAISKNTNKTFNNTDIDDLY